MKYMNRRALVFLSILGLMVGCSIFSTPSMAAISFAAPGGGATVKGVVTVTVSAPQASNPQAEKINLKVDNSFAKTQKYVAGKSKYSFSLNTRRYKNGLHKLTVLSIKNGRVVSTQSRWVRFANQALVLYNPKPDTVLSGIYNATGVVRARADKVNIKFDTNNSLVYSKPITNDRTLARGFSIRIDTTRLSDGPHNMIIRAVTKSGKDLKTITRRIVVQNNPDTLSFDATRIPIPDEGIYSGVYTVEKSTNWQARLAAIKNFEKLIYQRSDRRLSMDRQFYRWDNLVKNNRLNPYIKATSDAGRIPIISIHTLNQTPDANGSLEVQCPDGSAKKVWACIAAGKFDTKLRDIAVKIRDSGVPRLGFSFVLEPENEIRCHNKKKANPNYQCVPAGKGYDMGSANDYKKAWQRLVTIFDNTGVMNVDFIWILQATTFDSATRQPGFPPPNAMYPGDASIDWVSADPYNTAFNNNWKTLEQIAGGFVSWAEANTPSKPLMLAEFGAAEDPVGQDPAKRGKWFVEARAWLKTQPRIKAILYFNRTESFSSDETFRDWRIDTIAGTENYPRLEFRRKALPFTRNGFGTLMQDCYFLQGNCQ